MADSAVAWAEKMAGVLGERVKKSLKGDSPSPNGTNGAPSGNAAPSGSSAPSGNGSPGGNGTPTSGGTPTGGNAAPASGGAPTAAAPNGAGAPPAGAPATNGKADAAPAAASAAPTAAPAGSSAKAQAEAAKKALDDVNAKVSQATAADGEFKKFMSDAQAAKKQVDDARRQADAAEKSIPKPAPVPVPQGKDPVAQYDSAIQITGNVSKTEMEAQGKLEEMDQQAGAMTEAAAKIGIAQQGAAKSAKSLKSIAENARAAAESAASAASAATTAAAESKKKADQAAKDKAADAKDLQKAAQEDAKHAAAAKDAAAKAQANVKQVDALAKNAGTHSQSIEKLKQDATTAADATKKKAADFEMLAPHFDAIGKATQQEAQYKAKLSEADAEWVLLERYEKLGGDTELAKLMADEDKAFVTLTEQHRAELQQWQLRQIKDLDAYKTKLEKTLKDGEVAIPAQKQFVERERPLAEKAQAGAEALGEKLKTEPGKELLHEIGVRTQRIERTEHKIEYNEKLIEKTQAAMDELSSQYGTIDEQYEASEKVIADSRTELDNECEMNAMSLENKVYFLQTQPKPVRDRIQKNLVAERDRIVRLNVLEVEAMPVEYKAPPEPPKLEPIDWKSVQDKLTKIEAATLDQLKHSDPKLAEIQAEYEKAGGDPALLEKRVARWKKAVAEALESDRKRGDEYAAREEKLRQHHDEADKRMKESESNYNGSSKRLEYKRQRLAELEKKRAELEAGKSLPRKEEAELCLIPGEIKQLEIQVENYKRQSAADKSAQSTAASLLERERVRHEQVVDDDRHNLPQPTSDDIHKMPLKAKYTELTGKSVPANE
jgi:hypothetical protein